MVVLVPFIFYVDGHRIRCFQKSDLFSIIERSDKILYNVI